MTENLVDIYDDINRLLNDICKFLTTQIQNGTMSSDAQFMAKKLMERSVEKVDVINSIAKEDGSYLKMNGTEPKEVVYVNPDVEDIYEETYPESEYDQIDAHVTARPPCAAANIECVCPYVDSPLKTLHARATKHGPLVRKERYFIIDQKKQLYVALVDGWLLAYNPSKKDNKPHFTINMTGYQAIRNAQKKEPLFEMTGPGKTRYEFIARSAKEMEQWIAVINMRLRRNLPEIPSNNNVEGTEGVNGIVTEDDEIEYAFIYENVSSPVKPSGNKNTPVTIQKDVAVLPDEDSCEEYDVVQHPDYCDDEDDIYHDPREMCDEPAEGQVHYEEPITMAGESDGVTHKDAGYLYENDVEYNDVGECDAKTEDCKTAGADVKTCEDNTSTPAVENAYEENVENKSFGKPKVPCKPRVASVKPMINRKMLKRPSNLKIISIVEPPKIDSKVNSINKWRIKK